jgi:hypothetical protein
VTQARWKLYCVLRSTGKITLEIYKLYVVMLSVAGGTYECFVHDDGT